MAWACHEHETTNNSNQERIVVGDMMSIFMPSALLGLALALATSTYIELGLAVATAIIVIAGG